MAQRAGDIQVVVQRLGELRARGRADARRRRGSAPASLASRAAHSSMRASGARARAQPREREIQRQPVIDREQRVADFAAGPALRRQSRSV